MSPGKPPSGSSGAVTFRTLLWLAAAAVVLYAGLKAGVPYVKYQMMHMAVEEVARLSHVLDDGEMARKLADDASYWSLPVTEQDVIITRAGDDVTVEVRYTLTVVFPGGYSREFHYDIIANERLKSVDSSLMQMLEKYDFLLGRTRKKKQENDIPGLAPPVPGVNESN